MLFSEEVTLETDDKYAKLLKLLQVHPWHKSSYKYFLKSPPESGFYDSIYIRFPEKNLSWDVTDYLGQHFCPQHRIHGHILYYLHSIICQEGHTLADVRTVYENFSLKFRGKISCTKVEFFKALAEVKETHAIVVMGNSIWHHSNYEAENSIVHTLDDISRRVQAPLGDTSAYKQDLTEKQYAILDCIRTSRISIMDGLPGTGKTWTAAKIVAYLKANNIPLHLLAPTGLAAKTIGERCKMEARTIHSFVMREFTHTGDVAFIIDEFSMVDTRIFAKFLVKIQECNPILILIGDTGQLPSIGPGQILKELIGLRDRFKISYHSLKDIIRQEKDSEIIYNAHAIRRGDTQLLNDRQFKFFENDDNASSEFIIKAAKKLNEGKRDFIVLSPTHKGVCGVAFLNENLRQLFNPAEFGKQESHKGAWREGDKILVNQNFYDYGLVNGDIGIIQKIIAENQFVLKILDHDYTVNKDVIDTLKHAYALTVHKSQGQEFDTVLMPFVNAFSIQLQRKLFYTAVTRAKKQVLIFGNKVAVNKAITTDREEFRKTGLKILAG